MTIIMKSENFILFIEESDENNEVCLFTLRTLEEMKKKMA